MLNISESNVHFRDCGAKVTLLPKDKVKQRFPWLNCEDIEMASYGKMPKISICHCYMQIFECHLALSYLYTYYEMTVVV